ncbi:MAG: peptide deformylase [Herpetosiphon sp.]
MPQLSIVTGSLHTLQLPGLILRQKAKPVPSDISVDQLRHLLEEMMACMYQAGGVGIAAPQVGVSWRMFVLHTILPMSERAPLVLINPVIADMSDAVEEGREGCLSIPGYMSLRVPRAQTVRVEGFDHRLEPITVEASGDLARGIQHEYDHLDGILYIDHLKSHEDLEVVGISPWVRRARTLTDPMYEPSDVPAL